MMLPSIEDAVPPMTTPSPPALSDVDFDAIVSAVMETNRGRWFLAEYARRNRHADTQTLLAAIERLECVMRRDDSTALPIDRVRVGLTDMASAIARTKQEIAALRPDDRHAAIEDASGELDAIVNATERATSDILAAAEQIQERAWALREQGTPADACDHLDALATDVYMACSFQDLTGQRTRKVINVLRYLEARVDAMIQIWGDDLPKPAERPAWRGDDALLNGPAGPGQGLDQADVDMVMGPSAVAELEPVQAPIAVDPLWVVPEGRPVHPAAETAANDQPDVEFAPASGDADEPAAAAPHTLAALSYEERIALFT